MNRSKILTIIGIIMLTGIILLGFFGFPVGILFGSIVGLCFGIYKKDQLFIKWSSIALILDVVFIIYFCIQIQHMG
ncbi:hypothetical protein [Bacteroides faecalis]|uniref:Uncharacterized protein n=1 Tax=Bacteroides faecalis TaxID=2447885 RepID=A0A401LQQ5_9BACE|nr:hypothetical protein [Bacteroides faecalis]GCB33900.1 hypothetical protein KGMB02408_08450 [Bacteroides faecalis]